jgi:uncharacterized DUF497 family protein
MSYFVLRGRACGVVDWSHRREHVEDKGITTEQANEALDDSERVLIDPDPRSVTGESVRVIGYSEAAGAVLTVVVVVRDGQAYGATVWRANRRELRLYKRKELR